MQLIDQQIINSYKQVKEESKIFCNKIKRDHKYSKENAYSVTGYTCHNDFKNMNHIFDLCHTVKIEAKEFTINSV